jgi:mono/diheme cytochrome c family protein
MLRRVSQLNLLVCMILLVVCSGCSAIEGVTKSHDQQVAEGRALYDANGCGTCHGPDGRGDGPVSKAMHSSPRDFHNPASFVNGYGVGQIARTIGTGLTQGNQIMPPYPHLSVNDRELLATFVMSLSSESKQGEQKQ